MTEAAKTQDSKSRKLDQYIVRFPDGMRDMLKAEAAKNNRSLNAEIIARIEMSFAIEKRLGPDMEALKKAVKEVEEMHRHADENLVKTQYMMDEVKGMLAKLNAHSIY